MAIDVTAVASSIQDGLDAALAVGMAWTVAHFAVKAMKLLRDDGMFDSTDGDGEDFVACEHCDEGQPLAAWEESGGMCLACGAPNGAGWYYDTRECEICGVELPAIADDGNAHVLDDEYRLLCKSCVGAGE